VADSEWQKRIKFTQNLRFVPVEHLLLAKMWKISLNKDTNAHMHN